MYEIFEKLCKSKGITPYRFEKDMGVSSSTVSTWKTKNSLAGPELAQKVCDYFGVTTDFLIGKANRIQCEKCGQVYNPIDELERNLHDAYHKKCVIAKEKYPFLMDANFESGLAEAYEYEEFKRKDLTNEQRIATFEKYLQAKFTNYLNHRGFNLDGINYEDFCKSEVSMLEPCSYLSENLISSLAEKYHVDTTMMSANSLLLARASKNPQLIRLLAYAEKLNPEMLDMLEVQLDALVDKQRKISDKNNSIKKFSTAEEARKYISSLQSFAAFNPNEISDDALISIANTMYESKAK